MGSVPALHFLSVEVFFFAAPALRSAAGDFAQGREKSKTAAGDPRSLARAVFQRSPAGAGQSCGPPGRTLTGRLSNSAGGLGAFLESGRSLTARVVGGNFSKNFFTDIFDR